MPRPICVKCQVEFRMETAGILVVETCQRGKEIYKLWNADLWVCRNCGAGMVQGYPNDPIAGNWDGEEKTNSIVEKAKRGGRRIIYNDERFMDRK